MATPKVWLGDREACRFEECQTDITESMVVLDAVHQIRAEQVYDLTVDCSWMAGRRGSCFTEVNGTPKIMCMTCCRNSSAFLNSRTDTLRSGRDYRPLVVKVAEAGVCCRGGRKMIYLMVEVGPGAAA